MSSSRPASASFCRKYCEKLNQDDAYFKDKSKQILYFVNITPLSPLKVTYASDDNPDGEEVEIDADLYSAGFAVTNYGPIFMTYFTDNKTPQKLIKFINPEQNFTQVNNVWFQNGSEAMPAGWRHLVATPDLPYVPAEAMVSSYMQNHPSLLSLISAYDSAIKPSQAMQIEITDYESARVICTLRYFPDRKHVVINVGDDPTLYATSLRPCERMFISNVSIVERSTAFPVTLLQGNFADNQVHPDVSAGYLRPRSQNFY